MNLIRVLSGACATIAAVASLSLMTLAHAQSELDGQVHAKGEPVELRLSVPWYETEGAWRGQWTPMHYADRDGAYDANWTTGNQSESATLQIRLAGNLALITRTQHDGRQCHYRGAFNAARNVVTGTYTCDWAHTAMPWRATIGVTDVARGTNERPSLDNVIAYNFLPWLETEGAWRGRWTPRDADNDPGHFDAHWAHERESATAELQISVERGTGQVRVQRSDPDGRTCNYVGHVGGDFLSITGQYRCSDQPRTALAWSAHVIVPQR